MPLIRQVSPLIMEGKFGVGGMNADPCTTLRTCTNNIQFNTTSGTWSFINSRPSTRAGWTNKVNPICDNLSTRKVCSTYESCTNQTDRNNYNVAEKKTTFMCSTNGQSFLRRIYDEASSCIGNSTKTQLAITNRQTCKT
ncbi:hypothetical protein RRG08_033229 [Elysia crispata]|uniref:Uncharacterized protein n=1 Tax=Elysia crispata TaxID=231223 RepID=A0AAE1CRG4_9GAST|nr:hypothetical protein RRG08_033229 [Elysia crispata]